jgi:SpoVK/Ycf46/Vps4 family AAA+-type ATPase
MAALAASAAAGADLKSLCTEAALRALRRTYPQAPPPARPLARPPARLPARPNIHTSFACTFARPPARLYARRAATLKNGMPVRLCRVKEVGLHVVAGCVAGFVWAWGAKVRASERERERPRAQVYSNARKLRIDQEQVFVTEADVAESLTAIRGTPAAAASPCLLSLVAVSCSLPLSFPPSLAAPAPTAPADDRLVHLDNR